MFSIVISSIISDAVSEHFYDELEEIGRITGFNGEIPKSGENSDGTNSYIRNFSEHIEKFINSELPYSKEIWLPDSEEDLKHLHQ